MNLTKPSFLKQNKKRFHASVLYSLFFALCSLSPVFAQTSLRTNDSILVENAYVTSTSVIADPQGLVYTEFVEDTYIVHRETKTRFSGEILPPTIITDPPYLKNPKGRIREIVSFEMASDTLEDLAFIDKFDIAHQKNRKRAAIINGGELERTKLVKTIIPLFKPYGSPALWEYVGGEEDPWVRLGGRTEDTKEDNIKLFIASLSGTGIYVLFDEDPAPDESNTFIPYEEIQTAPEAPYTSVQPRTQTVANPSSQPVNGDELFNFQSTGSVNVPIDANGNPIVVPTSTTSVQSISPVIPAAGTTGNVSAFGVPADQFGLPGNFDLAQSSIISNPNVPSVSPKNGANLAGTTSPTFSPNTTQSSPSITSARVEDLIQQRLLQGTVPLDTPDLNTFNTLNEGTAPSSTTSNQTVESALLSPDTAKRVPERDAADVLLSEEPQRNPLLSEKIQEDDIAYSSAPEGDLPKTGQNRSPLLPLTLIFGLLGLGFWYWKVHRKPVQMSIKIK